MAFISMILGVIALVGAFIPLPIIGSLIFPIAIVGLILGLIARSKEKSRNANIGIILCLIALVAGIVMAIVFGVFDFILNLFR